MTKTKEVIQVETCINKDNVNKFLRTIHPNNFVDIKVLDDFKGRNYFVIYRTEVELTAKELKEINDVGTPPPPPPPITIETRKW
jgi:hypothetical protein